MSDLNIRREGRAGRITLTRPQALNALTLDMLRAIDGAFAEWEHDPDVALVLLDAEGERAFCSGGDIADVYRRGIEGDFEGSRTFFTVEYVADARIAGFPKPVVALMQGFVMGGGVGIGGHASHRVIGPTTRIAMPECMIGLVPDVGATHLLAQAPGRLGEYLGLTGHRMAPGDAILAGFADYYLPEARWPKLAAHLVETADVAIIATMAETPPPAELAAHRDAIDRAFAAEEIVGILAALASSEWGEATRATLEQRCALSLAATLALIRAARAAPGVEQALTREFRFASRAAVEGELLEGIRAAVIDKDRNPRWKDDLLSLEPERVAAMLAPLGEHELKLPAH